MGEKVVSKNYELEAVPKEQRKSFWGITMVWIGFVFVISSMMAGGGLSVGLTFKEIIFVTFGGNIFLSIIAILTAVMASRTGLTFGLLTRYSFGNKGSRIASLFVPIVNIGWYTIQSALYGHLIAVIFNLSPLGESVAMFASAIGIGIFALIGMDALSLLGFVAIPNIILLSIATATRATFTSGGISTIFSHLPTSPITLTAGLTIVIGTWILSASTCIADIMRYSKNLKEAVLSTILGLVGGNSLLIICGAVTSIAMKDSDLTNVLLSLWLIVPSIILMSTNIWTTNAANVYSTGLNLSNAFNKDSKKVMLTVLFISALLTLTRPYEIDSLFMFLDILGNVVPPLPGILFVDFYILNKGQYGSLSNLQNYDWNINAWISWIVAATFALTAKIGFAPLNGLIIGGALYFILMKILPKKISK